MIGKEKFLILDDLDVEIFNFLKKSIVIDLDVFHKIGTKRLSQYKDINLVLLNKKFDALNSLDCGNTIFNNLFGVTNSSASTISLIMFVMEADSLKKIIKNWIETNKSFMKNTHEDDSTSRNNIGLYHDYLKNIGWELFSFLEQYIKINNSMFSFWNILRWPEFYYRKESMLIFILANINSIEGRLQWFRKECDIDDVSEDYMACFFEYLLALKKAITLLKEWAKMTGDSRSPNKKSYTKIEIGDIFNQYKKAQEEYSALGWRLKLSHEKL